MPTQGQVAWDTILIVRPLNSALPGALAELLKDAPLSPGKVSFAWRAAVGAALERETSVRLEGSTLYVDAASHQWAAEVRRASSTILNRLQLLLGTGTVVSISVRQRV
jgi:predicted nucleic acid-binding Zn ribbon protein